MNITDVRIRVVDKPNNKMKAVASITIDGVFVVHDIKVIEGEKSFYILMPSKKDGNGEFKDIAHPINTYTRETIQKAIIDKYNEVIKTAE